MFMVDDEDIYQENNIKQIVNHESSVIENSEKDVDRVLYVQKPTGKFVILWVLLDSQFFLHLLFF